MYVLNVSNSSESCSLCVMWFVIGVWSVVSILLSFLVSAAGQAETDLTTTGRLWSMHICMNELCGLTVFERVSQEWLSSRLGSRSRLFRYPKLSAMCWWLSSCCGWLVADVWSIFSVAFLPPDGVYLCSRPGAWTFTENCLTVMLNAPCAGMFILA